MSQIAATALLLRTMRARNFALGVAYSKTEVLQVAVFGLACSAIPSGCQRCGSGVRNARRAAPLAADETFRTLLTGWTRAPRCSGLPAPCLPFPLSATAARRSRCRDAVLMAAAFTLLAAQILQTLLLGGWLLARDAQVVGKVLRAWRISLFAGFMGAAASAGWFTAFAIAPAAHVRTLGLVELIFSYAVSRRLFRERLSRLELAGMALLALGVAIITLVRP